jgi:hypothetical protein
VKKLAQARSKRLIVSLTRIQNLLPGVFSKKVLKRNRPYVVIERNTLDELARKHRKRKNIQNWIVE